MLEKLKRVRPFTFGALLAAIVAITVMVLKGWTPEQIGVVAGALLAVMSQLHRLIGPEDSKDSKQSSPPGAVILPFVFALGLAASACSSKAARAEAAYNAGWTACLAEQPTLDGGAPIEQRRAAWSRYDACLAENAARFRKDGGR